MAAMQKTPSTLKYPPFAKFVDWLDAERGRATTLRKELGIGASEISNAKVGRIPISEHWFDAISKVSKRKITVRELHEHRIAASLRRTKKAR